MLIRFLFVFIFSHLAAISAVRAANYDAPCNDAVEADNNLLFAQPSKANCIQHTAKKRKPMPSLKADFSGQQNPMEYSAALFDRSQNATNTSTGAAGNDTSTDLTIAEQYGSKLLTVLDKVLSKKEISDQSMVKPFSAKALNSLSNDAHFEAFTPFAPMFDSSGKSLFTTEDGAAWK